MSIISNDITFNAQVLSIFVINNNITIVVFEHIFVYLLDNSCLNNIIIKTSS